MESLERFAVPSLHNMGRALAGSVTNPLPASSWRQVCSAVAQLRFDGQRWWIVTVFWEAESAVHPLPAEYLPGGGRGG